MSASDREAAYQAWKDRLSQNKAAERDAFKPEEEEAPIDTAAGYWSTESLFRDSQLTAEQEQRERSAELEREARAAELLAVFDLPRTASLDDVAARYKAIALELHPDRHPQGTPEASRATLALVEYSAAYGELKGLL